MESMTIWIYSLIAGGVVIVIVAVLLVAILATARRIDKNAAAIWEVGKSIAGNTVSIWMLQRTNQVASEILTTVKGIEGAAQSMNQKLETLVK